MTTHNFVAGLLFAQGRYPNAVVLVRKNRPAWQAGKLNAVGGKIENGESPRQAMVREFREETGVETLESDWTHAVVLQGPDFVVHFFSAANDAYLNAVKTTTDEEIRIESIHRIYSPHLAKDNVIPNLRVVIAIALDDTGITKPVIMTDLLRNPRDGSTNDR